jgi:hypothetical protein
MPQHERRASARTVTQESGNIRATDAGEFDRNLDFSGKKFGTRSLLQFDLSRSGVNESSHKPEV